MPNDETPREIGAAAMRARFILEAAAGMGAQPDEPYREPEVILETDGGGPMVRLCASSTLDGITRVMGGEMDLAFLNPSSALTVAYRGKGSYFSEPQPVRAVTVLPSRDQCLFAVHGSTGLASIEDIGRAKYPLKLGVRGREEHWLHNMLDDIFAAAGFSIADLVAWGGEVRKTGHIPRPGTPKFAALVEGELTALFDEGVHGWADAVTPAGLTALKIEDETLARLEEMGYRRDLLARERYPTLPEDVPTLDFSGWPVFVRDDADDDMVRRVCAGLEARRETIPWEGTGPLPLDIMCNDTPEAPLGVPLHPAAEEFWKEQGYL
ncbi:MAG: TAXI family TRAP transporter solute-binding subunit [Alphaproteobacteria bacterium]|nr:TAXI family TRAP transporter solute-binding subunit [Alphaproteobacteria bacterium]